MNLTPTSITLFLVQIGTFLSGLIVAVCCCLYVASYPKSPEAGSLSPVASATLGFSILSSLVTLVLILRQKYGKTLRAVFESTWVLFASAMWILAAVGGIAMPANDMKNVSCRVLPSGKDTDDANFKRACQSMFASTAFCIVTALFFIATALMLFVFSIKRSVRDRKAKKVQVGGHYKLSLTPSQYRRAEKESEEGKNLKGAGEHEEELQEGEYTDDGIAAGHFSENVYRDPIIPAVPATFASPSHHNSGRLNPYLTAEIGLQQQQLQNQHHSSWGQQPAYMPY